MFGFIKNKVQTWASTTAENIQANVADKIAEQVPPVVFYVLLAAFSGIAVFLILLSISLYIGQILGNYLYGLFIFTALFVLMTGLVCCLNRLIRTWVRNLILQSLHPDSDKQPEPVEVEILEAETVKKLTDKK